MTQPPPLTREVRARFDAQALTVYQAYSPAIADAALAAGIFVPPFKRERMTWIKPSFLWMMYRSGWARKPGQERILAVRIRRDGFEWALAHSALSHYDPAVYADHGEWQERRNIAPVRVQWDPERSLLLEPLRHRAIQVGVGGAAVSRYVEDWVLNITDVTGLAHEIQALVAARDVRAAADKLPPERPYPLTEALRSTIGAS
jgi:hypothetical protein